MCDNKRKNDSFIFCVSCISCVWCASVWCASAWFCVYDGFSFGVLQWRELAALQQLYFCRPKGQIYYLEEEEPQEQEEEPQEQEQEEEQEEQEEEQQEQEEEQEEQQEQGLEETHLHQVLLQLLRLRKKTKV